MAGTQSPRRRVLTLTGADRHTDLYALGSLARENPWVEIALLVSESNSASRYWTFDEVWRAIDALDRLVDAADQLAIHVCGTAARQKLYGDVNIRGLCARLGRLQLNGNPQEGHITQVRGRLLDTRIITQVRHVGAALPNRYGRDYLVDASGGRGVLPAEWAPPDLDPSSQVMSGGSGIGFAGGLSPENISRELPRILAMTSPGWWIDLETHLRDDPGDEGKFSLDRAWLTVHEVSRVLDHHFDWRRVLP